MDTLTFVPESATMSSTMRNDDRVTMKLPREVHEKFKRLAQLRNRTMLAILESYLDTELTRLEEQEKRGKKPPQK